MKYVSLENFRTKDIIFGEPPKGKLPDGQELLLYAFACSL